MPDTLALGLQMALAIVGLLLVTVLAIWFTERSDRHTPSGA